MTTTYREFHRRSLADRDAFWREQAALVDWQTPFTAVLDYSKPPNTTEWTAPMRAQASIANAASAIIGM